MCWSLMEGLVGGTRDARLRHAAPDTARHSLPRLGIDSGISMAAASCRPLLPAVGGARHGTAHGTQTRTRAYQDQAQRTHGTTRRASLIRSLS